MAALSRLEVEERNLLARLQGISQAKAEVKGLAQRLEAAMAPIRKLPPELLSRIFEYTRDDDELHIPGTKAKVVTFQPFHMQPTRNCRPEHVCSLWRQVAQQTPLLKQDVWQVVKINFFQLEAYEDAEFPSSILELARFSRDVIARGTHTLHIDFGPWARTMEDDMEPPWVPDDELLDITLQPGLPHLEKIVIDNTGISQEFLDRCLELFASFPRLESVTLEYGISWDQERMFPLHLSPLRNLTELQAFPSGNIGAPIISTNGFYQILCHLPNHRTCVLQLLCNDRVPTANPSPVHTLLHDSLMTLELHRDECGCRGISDSCRELLAPFQHLTLPSLRQITVYRVEGAQLEPGAMQTFLEFVRRSQCHLETFNLEFDNDAQICLTATEWDAVAPYLTNLTSLFIPWLVLPAGLASDIADGRCLPHLNRVFCGIPNVDGHCQPRMIELLDSRRGQGKDYSYVWVYPEGGFSP